MYPIRSARSEWVQSDIPITPGSTHTAALRSGARWQGGAWWEILLEDKYKTSNTNTNTSRYQNTLDQYGSHEIWLKKELDEKYSILTYLSRWEIFQEDKHKDIRNKYKRYIHCTSRIYWASLAWPLISLQGLVRIPYKFSLIPKHVHLEQRLLIWSSLTNSWFDQV